jgi:hypothetical protein
MSSRPGRETSVFGLDSTFDFKQTGWGLTRVSTARKGCGACFGPFLLNSVLCIIRGGLGLTCHCPNVTSPSSLGRLG